ncbi:MAG TPA: hypothetical protein VF170_17275, partial [Planctomycetaceae bacterium]
MAAESPDASPGGFSPARLARLARKELRETLRDRRTILTLVLMPLFVYPLLGLTFQKFLLSQVTARGPSGRPEYVLGFATADDAARLKPLLEDADAIRAARAARAGERPDEPPIFTGFWPDDGTADVARLVRSGMVDVGIVLGEGNRRGRTAVALIFNPASPNGVTAKREIEDRL